MIETNDPNTVYPTGECFNNALEFLEDGVKRGMIDPRDDTWLLVHALCRMPDGKIYAHAWVERDDTVILAGINCGKLVHFVADRAEYYDYFDMQECTKYTMRLATQFNRETGNFGPWEQGYIDHCNGK